MAKKRHHSSLRKVSMHDREMDRENLSHARGHAMHHSRRDSAEHASHSMGYERERGMDGENYDRHDMSDREMLGKHYPGHANLPTEVMMREYPMAEYADFPYLDDTIHGIDNRMKEDKGGMRKGIGRDIKY